MIFIFDNGLINIGKESYELRIEATDHSYSIVLKTSLGDHYLLKDLGDTSISMDFAQVIAEMLFDKVSNCIADGKEVISMTACFDSVINHITNSCTNTSSRKMMENCSLEYTALDFVKKYITEPIETGLPVTIEHQPIAISHLATIKNMSETIRRLFELISKENKTLILIDSIDVDAK